jgi:hypothetical protein
VACISDENDSRLRMIGSSCAYGKSETHIKKESEPMR